MTFEEWATEARNGLQNWNPEPGIPPTTTSRSASFDSPAPTVEIEPPVAAMATLSEDRKAAVGNRRILSAAAALAVIAAAGVLAVTLSPGGVDVATGPRSSSGNSAAGQSSTNRPTPAAQPQSGSESSASPQFECSVVPDSELESASVEFPGSPDATDWVYVNRNKVPAANGSAPALDTPTGRVRGTFSVPEGETFAATSSRARSFISSMAPEWICNVSSPAIDVSDPTRPGPIVDSDNFVTNRYGGRCLVPDSSSVPGAVWGVDPSLVSALDQIEGLTHWNIVFGDNHQGFGRLWMEYQYESGEDIPEAMSTANVTANISAAVATVGNSAKIPTECAPH